MFLFFMTDNSTRFPGHRERNGIYLVKFNKEPEPARANGSEARRIHGRTDSSFPARGLQAKSTRPPLRITQARLKIVHSQRDGRRFRARDCARCNSLDSVSDNASLVRSCEVQPLGRSISLAVLPMIQRDMSVDAASTSRCTNFVRAADGWMTRCEPRAVKERGTCKYKQVFLSSQSP